MELHLVQDMLNFKNNGQTLVLIILLPEIPVIVLFLGLLLEKGNLSEMINVQIDLHQNHVQGLHLHLKDLLITGKRIFLKSLILTLETFQS